MIGGLGGSEDTTGSGTNTSETKGQETQANETTGSETTGKETTGSETTGKETKEEPKTAKQGTPVKSGDVEFTLSGYKCGIDVTDQAGQAVEAQGQWCRLDFSLKNVGKKQVTLTDDQIKLLDSEGVEYSTSSETFFVKDVIFLQEINPGNTKKLSLIHI